MNTPRKFYVRRDYVAITHDIIMAAASYYFSLYLRLDQFFSFNAPYIKIGLPVFTLICALTFICMKLYRGIWRYASLQDLLSITKAVTVSIMVFLAIMFFVIRLDTIPRSALVINWVLLIVMLGAPRFVYRLLKDGELGLDLFTLYSQKIPVLLIGAGSHADLFMRDSVHDRNSPYRVVGLTDEDKAMHGRNIHGVRVYGGLDSLAKIIDKLERKGAKPQRIIITEENISGDVLRDILKIAEVRGMSLARLPSLTEFKSGNKASINPRPVAIEDILGRPQNRLDYEVMKNFVTAKRVLITGGGGTIGGEIAKQIAGFAPESITILENSEFNLYEITRSLRNDYSEISIIEAFADVRDKASLGAIFEKVKPQIVFHAAAIKHVPIADHNPSEAVLTNVAGTINVTDASISHSCENLVIISTDKAVNPVGIMGATKRLAELYMQYAANHKDIKTRICAVRFGNVLASRGSVVPLFQEQIARGGPVTVSHPDITRYFMTLREAVGLVILAATLRDGGMQECERNGSVYVLEMGEPIRIRDMAEQMIRLSGLKPYENIAVICTGLRSGEKLYEELFYEAEQPTATSHTGIRLAKPLLTNIQDFRTKLEAIISVARNHSDYEIITLMQELVSDYKPVK